MILLLDYIGAILEGLGVVCRIQNENELLNCMVRIVIESFFVHRWQVICTLQDINSLQGISLCGTDEIDEGNWLID